MLLKFRSELFRSHSKNWYVDLRTNSDFRSRSFDLIPPTPQEQGHWPVLFDIEIPVKIDIPTRCVLNYKMANWEERKMQLENIMVENMDSMITEAPTKAFPTIMGLVRGACENSIPRKTLCKYSKPYWSNKLIH